MKNHYTFMHTMGFALFGLIILAIFSSGCATSGGCLTAKQVAAESGKVVACWRFKYEDSGEWVDRCSVSDADGNVRVKTVFATHCGLK